MMYDDNFLYSYCDRVKKNYETLKDSEFEVTMLLCSFVSVLAAIDDSIKEKLFRDSKIPNYVKPTLNVAYKETKTLAFYRHLRNSFCHLKIDNQRIMPDSENNISNITLEDYLIDKKGKRLPKKTFECTLTVAELKELFYEVVAIIHEKTKKQED